MQSTTCTFVSFVDVYMDTWYLNGWWSSLVQKDLVLGRQGGNLGVLDVSPPLQWIYQQTPTKLIKVSDLFEQRF